MSESNPCDPDDPVTDQGRANSSPWVEPPVCPIAVPNNTGEVVWIDGKPVFLLGPGIGSAEGGGPDCPPVPPPAVKFVTAAENVGTGTGLYLQTVDGVIELRTLGAGTNISFAIVGNTLVISSSGGLSAVAWDDVTGKPTVFSPSAHAASHTDGTDDIQDATAAQKGLMTAAYGTKLDGIEALADVTDATNVNAAGAVMESDFDANTILAATADNTPTIRTIAESDIIGRLPGGEIAGITSADLTEEATPVAGDFLLGWESGGAIRKFDVGDLPGGGDVATDAIWDAAGDLAVGTGANTAAKLAIGANGTVLTSNGTTATWAAASGGAVNMLTIQSFI